MGRANNTARSLQIMAKLQGWDPCKIDGKDFPMLEYDEDERQTGVKPGPAPKSPEDSFPGVAIQGPDTRTPGPGGQGHGKHDPNAGK